MKRKLSTALLCAALVAAVGVVWGISASRQGFSLIASNREMNSNQILFPDRETTKADQNQTDSDDSYWKQDNAGDKANQNGGSSGVLFDRDVTLPDGAGTAISGGDTAGGATGGPGASNVVDIVEPGNGGADIIIPGGGGSGNNSGQGGGSSEGPIPGYGSSSKDKLNTDYVRPTYGGEKDFHYSENTGGNISQGGNYTLNIRQAYSANQAAGEGLYMGQKNVNVDTIFQSLEAFVLDEDNYVNYYWTLDDLYQEGKDESKCYIKITGVSFGYFSDEIITDFPVDMPTDQNYIIIYVSYRFRLSDDWTEYTGVFSPGVEYSLWKSRILVLREALTQEGQLIGKEDLLNSYAQYLDTWSDGMNLLEFQREMIGPKGTRLTTLFPGWMVDGLPAPILYDPGPGRYVLEPGKRVELSSDYQVESREYWMKPDMEVLPSGQSEFNAKWVALQTLTDYLGADKVNDYVTHLKVPQFVQAVDFPYYPGVTADYLDLPETVLYVNTDGIASIDEDFLLYDRGLQVTRGYTVAEGYETFADCTALQGVVIGAKDRFLLSSGAFDGCSSLRFVASNAANIRLEDPDLELTVLGYSNSFLFAPTESQGYNRNWTSFNAAAGITGYQLVDCGGTQVLYATDESGTPWLALRAGSLAYGPVTLPTGTIEIFSCTFMDTKSRAEDAVLTLNWDQLTSLGWIDKMSFMNSDLGRDVTLPENLAIDYRAFKSCGQLENIVIPGTPDLGLYIGDEALYGCVNLHTVTFGDFRLSSAIQPSLFSGSGVRELIFTGYYIPELTNFGYGSPFYFEYDQEAAGELKITVPAGREEECMLAWRYNLAGYPAAGEQTGFQVLWSEIDRDNPDLSYQEKMDKVDSIILEAENRMRVLLGMPEASQVTRPFTVVIDENDFITLVAARNIGSQTALSSDELDLPQNWALDFIASGAFRESPELRQVTVPETLTAIEHDAFAGLTFQEDDPYDVLYLYMADSSGIFGLNVRQEGTPFSFGVDDERVQVICSNVIMEDEDALATFIQFWTAPMAGYSDAEALENAVRAKLGPDASDEDVRAEMERILLPAENRVRQVLFCVEPTQELTFQFTLQGREAAGAGETEEVSPVEELSARKGKVADLAYIDRIDDKKEEELA